MKNVAIILALIPGLMITACHRGNKKNPIAAASEASKDKDLQRTWQSECSADLKDQVLTNLLTGFKDSVKSYRVQYEFKGNAVTRSTIMYTQAGCAEDAWIFEESGNFKLGDGKQVTNDGGKKIDLDMRDLTLSVRNAGAANAANAIKLCGKANWAADNKPSNKEKVNQASKGVNCYGAAVPRKVSNVYRIENKNRLLLGGEMPTALPSSVTSGPVYSAK